MRRNQSQFIKIQPFIQTLRPSLRCHKDNLIQIPPSNQIVNNNQPLVFNPRQKSLSNSKILKVTRKNSTGSNFKLIHKNNPECIFTKNQLEINFNKICLKDLPSNDLKDNPFSPQIQNYWDLKDLKISVIFSKGLTEIIEQTNPFAFSKIQRPNQIQDIKIKLEITCFELSIEDESKVKRIFDINLIEKLDKKQYLKIQFSQGLTPQILALNNKIVTLKEQMTLPLRQSDKLYDFKPWELINKRKSLLQDKILSQRPKSKIKWSFSLTQQSENVGKSDLKVQKFSQIQENYGLAPSKQNALKFSMEFKSRSQLNLNMQTQNSHVNVFTQHAKYEEVQKSLKSTFESDDRSSRKQQSGWSNEPKRANNIVGSLNFKDGKLIKDQNYEDLSKQLRPKSSFKNLKDKNDYFQMRESQRKKSVKKHLEPLKTQKQKSAIKSSEIKQEYGIS